MLSYVLQPGEISERYEGMKRYILPKPTTHETTIKVGLGIKNQSQIVRSICTVFLQAYQCL